MSARTPRAPGGRGLGVRQPAPAAPTGAGRRLRGSPASRVPPAPGARRRAAAAITVRVGGAGAERTDHDVLAHHRERELGDQADADARRHQPLHGLVVVALEGHARLEAGRVAAAHDVAGAGARARGLHPRLRPQVLQRQTARSPAVARAGAPGTCGSSSSSTRFMLSPASVCAGELEQQREVELAGAQPRRDLLRLALGQRQLDVGWRPGSSRSRAASAWPRRWGRRPSAGGRRAGRRSPPSAASAASSRARMPSACPTSVWPAAVRLHARAGGARAGSSRFRPRASRSAGRSPTACRRAPAAAAGERAAVGDLLEDLQAGHVKHKLYL